jgi:hypothetical protein
MIPWDAPKVARRLMVALGLKLPPGHNGTISDVTINNALDRVRANPAKRAEVRRVLRQCGLIT